MMKKLLMLNLFLIGFFTGRAQIVELDKEITDSVSWFTSVINSSDIVFYLANGDCSIYDENLDFIKSISSSSFGENCNIEDVSKNIFLKDGTYEVTVGYILRKDSIFDDSGNFNYERKIYGYKVCNESGNTLFDFGEYNPIYYSLAGTEGIYAKKLLTKKEMRDSGTGNYYYYFKVYTLPNFTPYNPFCQGNENSTKSVTKNMDRKIKLYPNPTKGNITIEYKLDGVSLQPMEIMTIGGKLMERVLLNPMETQVKVNTGKYSPGVYVYRIGETTGKFTVR